MRDRKEIATSNGILNDFFLAGSQNSGMIRKTVISGSLNVVRTKFALMLAENVCRNGNPVVIVHRSNLVFNEKYRSGTAVYNGEEYVLDLFGDISENELASVLYEVGKSTTNLGIEAKTVISIGIEALKKNGDSIDLLTLCSFPWEMISAFIFNSRNIDVSDKLVLIQRLAPFSEQIPAVAALFTEFKVHLMEKQCVDVKKISLSKVLQGGACIVSIDVGTDINDVLAETLFSLLKLNKEKGYRFLSVIDSIPASNENSIAFKLYRSTDVQSPVMIVSPDLAQSYAGKLGLFNDIVGSGTNVVVLAHTSGYSADVWSTYFGEYYAQKEEVSSGNSRENYRFFSKTSSNTVTRSEERRRIILHEDIIMLDTKMAIVQCGYKDGERGWRYNVLDLSCLGGNKSGN